MSELASVPPPPPARALTLDLAWERAYRRLVLCVRAHIENELQTSDFLKSRLAEIAHQLTKDLIDAGVGGTLAYQLARPPASE